jgi:signal transduction histidine kinase/ActR/RegA family two-component response regulator
LEIRAGVREGTASSKVAVAEFVIEPRWWETWWFRSLAGLLAAAAVCGVILWRHGRLRRRNRQLEEAVSQRTVELESERLKVLEEKRRADEANEAKGRFLANMSHEIRTPLNGVIGLSRLLEGMEISTEARDIVRLICSCGDSLLGLINDILDLSKVEAGKLELEMAPFHLHRALEDSIGLFRATAENKGVLLRCAKAPDLPVWVRGDETRLRQVIVNLVSNALKFTSSGDVVLSASSAGRDVVRNGDFIAIAVRDTGIGMTPEQMSGLFSSFQQADASISRRYGGTGLGLAISKHLVELMGGTIHVDSKPGEGTRFRFTLPMERAEEPLHLSGADAPEPPVPAGERRLLRVLVAEDNAVNQKVALMQLAKLSVKADLAVDGSQAIEAATAHCYDLILMDVQMPEVDGLTATREIRRLPLDHQPVIYGLTAHATTEHRDECLRAGMDGYLTKPLDRLKLRALIEELSTQSSPVESSVV